MLFFIVGSLLGDFLLYNHPMWTYRTDHILPGHTASTLVVDFVAFPCTILLFLPYFPKPWLGQLGWVLLWGAIYSAIELMMHSLGFIVYDNGWTLWFSLLFDFAIFGMLMLHYRRPLLSYLVSLAVVVGLLWAFRVPLSSMK